MYAAELLDLVREKRAADSLRKEVIKQLTETREQLHLDLRQNILQALKDKMIWIMECKKRETIFDTPVESRSEMKCYTRELERCISRLGVIVEVPRYTTSLFPIAVTGKKGRAPGELYEPRGVAIHEETHQIFVANCKNHRVEVFSETGEFLSQLGVGQLSRPWGISIHRDSVYVSCQGNHTVSKFSLTEICRVRRLGGRGSNNGQFNSPTQLTTDPIGRVFIADLGNDRICIHDPDLNHLYNIKLPSRGPYDVKVSHDCIYVLCPRNIQCMHVLTLEGEKLRSLITCGRGMDVLCPVFFSLVQLCPQR